jgi:hypothetical protein
VKWPKDEVLAAVGSALSDRPDSRWLFERADLNGHEVQVVFRLTWGEPGRYAVVYSLEPFEGPNTGIECDSLSAWASEIGWDLDENIDTGGLHRAARTVAEDGLVVLDWLP